MNNEPTPEGNSSEILNNYPELSRARDFLIELFSDRSPLRILGYTEQQIAFAVPALDLIQDEGSVGVFKSKPYLSWSKNHDSLAAEIESLPNKSGYRLTARRDEVERGSALLSPAERLMKMIYSENPVIIFKDFDIQVADILLFKPETGLGNLDALVKLVTEGNFYWQRIKKENPLTKISQKVGIAPTYRAAWIDEGTKLEFVIEIKERGQEPQYLAYRRLNTLSDSASSVIPFGKKANATEQKVKQALEAKTDRVVQGNLAYGKTTA